MTSKKNCHYCEFVKFESDDVNDRNKLMDKKPFVEFYDLGLYINGPELLTIKYGIGYFKVVKRISVEFCPICGINFKEREAE